MRTQLLGLTTATLAAGTLSLGLSAPAHAVGGIDGGNISNNGDVPTSVDVVATGPGDAVAAWTRPTAGGSRVYASFATDGVWSAPQFVTQAAVEGASDAHVVANRSGDVAVVWTQLIGGKERVRGSRYTGNGTWDGSTPLSGESDEVERTEVVMDDAGRVYVANSLHLGVNVPLRVTTWAEGQQPVDDLIDGLGQDAAITVSPSGVATVAYRSSFEGDDVLEVSRRTPTTGWTAPEMLEWPHEVGIQYVADSADDGTATVLFISKEAALRATAVEVGPDGLGTPTPISPEGVTASHLAVSVNPDGRAIAGWSSFVDNQVVVRSTVRNGSGAWSPWGTVQADTENIDRLHPLLSDRGFQAVVHNGNGALTVRYRTNPIHLFSTYAAGPADDLVAADMDPEGNVVTVGAEEAGFSSYVQARFLDLAGPAAVLTAPGAQATSAAVPVAWTATDSLAGVKSTDVMVRTAAWNGGFGPQQVIGNDVAGSSLQFSGSLGSTHCFQVQATDKTGNLGLRSEERCTTVPLDDTALNGKKWKRIAKAGAFNNTTTLTKKKGRKLTLSGVQARHLDLLVSRAKKGGKVKVLWNGQLIKKVSLKGKGQATIALADFPNVQTGDLTLKVTSRDGRKVAIDGLVVAKS
ncbi:hypothetical protein [Pimelobacter simplex]|uniref:hypothetical protein n=1 Tax=Nocardioides simplex TaxID=2045 RepID=UPI001932A49B|nr:hypothetical protein [Pimelobacter simplex]